MILKRIIFCIIVALWLSIGIIGSLRSREFRINWEMIFFISFSCFMPIIGIFLLKQY